jgi:tetratricopeptide (TPR) repeat protein
MRKKGYRAIADCSKAIELDPKYPYAYGVRCWTPAIIGQLQQALVDCSQSVTLKPNDQALSGRGFTYLKLGEYDKAIADYDVALKINPNDVHSLYGRGIAELKKGESNGNADIAAAEAIAPGIAEDFARYGLK